MRHLISSILFISLLQSVWAQHPSLSLTRDGVEIIKNQLAEAPLFEAEIKTTITELEPFLLNGVDVPVPKDMAGGYTHERHKANYKLLYKAGNLYQLTGEEKYADFVKETLFKYKTLYPQLPKHPTNKSYATGKIFWQCLNDANWLVFVSQAYDCIYNYLSESERAELEKELFIPFANYLSIENPKFFNRIHNHSTWANAAVGMIALVMDNDSLLQKSLYGLQNDGIDPNAFDNDGGFIKKDGITQAGFLAQLDYSFSPDGYFAEGPYYLRYAIFPFLTFAQALHNNKPELDIFNYRDGILKKATKTLLELTNFQGQFFPINDAQKGMDFTTYELVYAVDLIYRIDDSQKFLLDWASFQDAVSIDESGFYMAYHLGQYKAGTPVKSSSFYRDGINGDEGGVAVLRSEDLELLFKFSTQGMGHGHFDRLSYSLIDKKGEVFQDYGAVRWVNIDQKAGGRYLPENKTFGKQSIAHNTIVLDQTSHYNAVVKDAEAFHPELVYFNSSNPNQQMVSVKEDHAYEEAGLQRTLLLISDEHLVGDVLLDIFSLDSEGPHSVDLPFWFQGDIMNNNLTCEQESNNLKPLGTKSGYEHIWKLSSCPAEAELTKFNWLANDNFYTLFTKSENQDSFLIGMSGAKDPNFNIRNDRVLIQRRLTSGSSRFVNLIEAHGNYSRITEIPIQPYGSIAEFKVIYEDKDYIACQISNSEYTWIVTICETNSDENSVHSLMINDKEWRWQGFYNIEKSKN